MELNQNNGLNTLQPKDTEIQPPKQSLNDFQQIGGEVLPPDEAYKEIRQIINSCRIGLNDDLYPPEYILHIGGVPVMGLNDFSLIIGKAKSRKTFAMTLIMAVFLCRIIEQMQSQTYGNKTRLIWFDTEQSPYYVQRAYKTALRLAGYDDAPELEVYSLRPYSPQERQAIINHVLYSGNSNNDILFAIIDGIRDLVTDINDQQQATDISTWLLKVTADKGMHISTVLHTNKNDSNARGHLGTELTNKAQSTVTVEKSTENKDISIVKPDYCRDKDFEPFAFRIEDDLPVIDAEYVMGTKSIKKAKGKSPFDYELNVHKSLASEIFSNNNEIAPTDLRTNIKLIFAKNFVSFGDNISREFLKHWENEGIISSNGEAGRNKKYQLSMLRAPLKTHKF